MNSVALPDKGIRCLNSELGIPDAERFVALLLRKPFDYTEWRKENLFAGMSLGQIIDEADSYCRENPQAGFVDTPPRHCKELRGMKQCTQHCQLKITG